ncbi:hypothetical protein [Duganella qianjiadongensis]|uniref:Uncharacterized protein n=1 Tax=Duganella qianjiadongensis TaxID=2692176 RepID=A0ABW9VJQ4_9BURK|nr:hypothetical protein [Duganella qianjiadongensis]MYM38890.1 hypothetical protein [Duganella qianjiadongensis]
MDASETIPIERRLLERLTDHLARRGGAPDLQQALNAALEMWLGEQLKLRIDNDPASVRGYQWKTVFLPEGTLLCTRTYGESQYARVHGEEIIFQGRAVTPNRLAHWAGRGRRNAWNDIYVRRPQDKFYIRAQRLRAQLAQELERVTSALPVPAPVASNSAEVMSAVVTALQASEQTKLAFAALFPSPAPDVQRDCSQGEGWNLPERRKYRYRIEDVAFS